MQVVSETNQIQGLCKKYRDNNESIAFVPTMGCLHEGHLSLVDKAKSLADQVVVSIFVNPLQFDNKDDLAKYPNTLDEDVAKLADVSVDMIFTPEVNSFYPEGVDGVEQIDLGEITTILEGAHRPGHFAGVATVVKGLFDLIQPNTAIFGEKDFQQLKVIHQLVERYSLDVKIIGMPTFRESNGLAMSSRNVRLNKNDYEKASKIYQQLDWLKSEINAGATNYSELEQIASNHLLQADFEPEYVSIRKADTLMLPLNPNEEMVILIAAKLGTVRLIDNMRV